MNDLTSIPKTPGLLFPKNAQGETLFVVSTDGLQEKARDLKTAVRTGKSEAWGNARRFVARELSYMEWHEMPDSDKETRESLARELDRFSLSVRTDAIQLRQAIALLEEKGYTVSK
jgi:hypothetical protein